MCVLHIGMWLMYVLLLGALDVQDLAGSERTKQLRSSQQGPRFRETVNINQVHPAHVVAWRIARRRPGTVQGR